MAGLKKIKVRTKLLALMLVAVGGLLGLTWLSHSTLSVTEVNGPLYNRIALDNALFADMVPPALFVQEASIAVSLMENAKTSSEVKARVEEIKSVDQGFEDAAKGYRTSLPEGPLKDIVVNRVYPSGRQYLDEAEKQYIPLLQSGDAAKAAQFRVQTLDTQFEAHKQAVDEALKLLDQQTKADQTVAADTVRSRTILMFTLAAAIVIAVSLLGWYILRGVTGPLHQTVDVLLAIAGGDLTSRVALDSEDEIGQMAQALNHTVDTIGSTLQKIKEEAENLAAASDRFMTASQQISANSEETSAQASLVSTASEDVNRNLQTVSTGADEMLTTIRDIAKNSGDAARVANEAVRTAESTNTTISSLGESSAQIGQVIKVITAIAQQTNLLALNATIEAARAGEAGKGFAVVANEVKQLAKQTAQATEDIRSKIGGIQEGTKGAVEAIGAIGKVINQVNQISNTIAAAVEEQSATTNEMSRNVTEAAKGSEQISENMRGMLQAAHSTSETANDTRKGAEQLGRMSAELRRLVQQFKLGDPSAGNGHHPAESV
jgi:methyl-accepting chemotaxis protein